MALLPASLLLNTVLRLYMCQQEVIVSERRFQYEAEVKASPQNYDFWFDYIRLEESAGDHDRVRLCFQVHNLHASLHANALL